MANGLKALLVMAVVSTIFIENGLAQGDTVPAQHVKVLPVIDGVSNDICWIEPGVEWKSSYLRHLNIFNCNFWIGSFKIALYFRGFAPFSCLFF